MTNEKTYTVVEDEFFKDGCLILDELPTDHNGIIRVALVKFNGETKLDIRKFKSNGHASKGILLNSRNTKDLVADINALANDPDIDVVRNFLDGKEVDFSKYPKDGE